MIEKKVFTHSTKRSDQRKTLGSASAILSPVNVHIEVNLALMLQSMMTVATGGDMNLKDVMS